MSAQPDREQVFRNILEMGLLSFGHETDAPRRPSNAAPRMRVDPLLPKKRRARYRLAGAILLVLVAVIALPKLLHSPSQPDAGEIELWVAAPTSASDASSNAVPASASLTAQRSSADTSAQSKTLSRSYFAVQAGTFSREQEARAQLARLRKAHLPAYLEREKQDHGARFLVRAGPFSDRQQAETALKQLHAAGLATNRAETQ